MRVIALSHLNPVPTNNGAKLRIAHLLRELGLRHELALLSPAGDQAALREWFGPQVTLTPIEWPLAHGQRRRIDWLRRWPRDVQPAQPAAAHLIASMIERWQPDLLLATDPVLGEYLRPYSGLHRAIDIAAEHSHFIRRTLQQAPLTQRPLWLLRLAKWVRYMRSLGSTVDQWIVPAPADRAALLRLLPNAPVAVVPNGVDAGTLRYQPATVAEPTLVFCGALSYAPNADGLHYFCAQIWPRVLRQLPRARLLVTGESSNAPAAVRNAPNITLLGHLPEVQSTVRSATVSIVPLRLGVGTRLKILEAMALGTPVVSTSLGAEGLDVRDGHNILIGDRPAVFAAQVVRLLRDDALRGQLSRAGRQLAEQRYAWPVLGTAFSNALTENIEQRTVEQV